MQKNREFLNGIVRSIEIGFLVEGCPRIYIVPNTVVVMPEAERSDISVFGHSLWSIDSVED